MNAKSNTNKLGRNIKLKTKNKKEKITGI